MPHRRRREETAMDSLPIGDYALLSDCHSAGLVNRAGSVDWLCLPRFDAPSVFCRLLDPAGGHFAIRPAGEFRVSRRYLDQTMVLETTFTTAGGTSVLTDALATGCDERGHRLGGGAPRARCCARWPAPRARSRRSSATLRGRSTGWSIRSCFPSRAALSPGAAPAGCSCRRRRLRGGERQRDRQDPAGGRADRGVRAGARGHGRPAAGPVDRGGDHRAVVRHH